MPISIRKKGKTSKQNHTTNTGKATGWQDALERANNNIRNNKIQASKLRAAARFFTEMIAKGEPWPSESDK